MKLVYFCNVTVSIIFVSDLDLIQFYLFRLLLLFVRLNKLVNMISYWHFNVFPPDVSSCNLHSHSITSTCDVVDLEFEPSTSFANLIEDISVEEMLKVTLCNHMVMNSMQTCNSVIWKNKFSDISRKCILPDMIRKG